MLTVQERPGLVVLTIELEGALAQMPGSLSPSRMWSPYRQPLAKFLNKYSADVSQSVSDSWCTDALGAILCCDLNNGDVAPALLCCMILRCLPDMQTSSMYSACSKHLLCGDRCSMLKCSAPKLLLVKLRNR